MGVLSWVQGEESKHVFDEGGRSHIPGTEAQVSGGAQHVWGMVSGKMTVSESGWRGILGWVLCNMPRTSDLSCTQ